MDPPPESRTPLCGLRARCITRQCLRGVHPRSAREDSNLRAPVYQTGAWTGSATGGAGETRTHKTNGSGGFRDRFLIQPDPLHIRWGGLEPPPRGSQSRALPGELRTWGLPVGFDPTPSRLRGGRSASLSYRSGLQGRDSNPRRAAYEAAARPLSYPASAIPPEGFEPSRARGPRRSERRAYAFRHGGKQSGSGGNRTRNALGFNQPLYR
jgi:hypothetical protein